MSSSLLIVYVRTDLDHPVFFRQTGWKVGLRLWDRCSATRKRDRGQEGHVEGPLEARRVIRQGAKEGGSVRSVMGGTDGLDDFVQAVQICM